MIKFNGKEYVNITEVYNEYQEKLTVGYSRFLSLYKRGMKLEDIIASRSGTNRIRFTEEPNKGMSAADKWLYQYRFPY